MHKSDSNTKPPMTKQRDAPKTPTKSNGCYTNKGWLGRAKENCRFFLESTSIRGCARIVRSDNRIIRYMWATYICFTTLFLFFSIVKLIHEYCNYSVNIQTYQEMDAPMDFPAVTFCNHQPFSQQAYELWDNGSVLSPTKFNQLLRRRAADLMAQSVQIPENDSDDVLILNRTVLRDSLAQIIMYDTLPLYYQSIQWPWHLKLGHSAKGLVVLCLLRYKSNWAITGPGCEDSEVEVRRLSNPKFFNCFTVEIKAQLSREITELGMVLWLGPDENYGKEARQAFLFDLFEQAYGLRVAIHEPGQMAELERNSFQIAPGQLNEMIFQTVQNIHYNRPTMPCIHNPRQTFSDLDQKFFYEFELCLSSHLQKLIVRKCGCLFAYYPRIYEPNATLTYCGNMLDDSMKLLDSTAVDERKNCAQSIVRNAAVYRKDLEDSGVCMRRCVSTQYESSVSVTKWRPTGWQLFWTQKTSSFFDELQNRSLTPAWAKMIEHFLSTNNLEDYNGSDNPIVFDDRYTYLVVKRKSNDTIVREENLVITVNALFSRIGGFCSLYIGLTMAVVMEIVEFFYVSWINRKSSLSAEVNDKPNESSPLNPTPTAAATVVDEDHVGLEQAVDETVEKSLKEIS